MQTAGVPVRSAFYNDESRRRDRPVRTSMEESMTISPRGDDLQPAARWLPRRHGPVFRVLAVLLVLLLAGPLIAPAAAEELEDLIQESGRYVGDWTKRPLYNLILYETLAL